MLETELKLELDGATERHLRRNRSLAAISRGRPTTRLLRSVYFDTSARDLARAGMALRLRNVGRRWTQTIKLGQVMRAGLSLSEEHDCAAPGGRLVLDQIPDRDVRDILLDRVEGRALAPVFETHVQRTTRILDLPGSVVEMALDRGEIIAGERRRDLSELELELIEGDPAGLFALLRQMLPEGGLRFSPCSKAVRGMRLADGIETPRATAARHAEPVAIDPGQTMEEAARDILREAFDQISGNITWLRDGGQGLDPNGLKQLRIGLRRLRTTLTVFRDGLGGAAADALKEEARWLAGEVGRLRDLDVALTEMIEPEMAATDDPGFAALHAAVTSRRAEMAETLETVLISRRLDNFLIDLVAFIETRGWLLHDDLAQTRRLAEPVAALARTALAKRWRKAKRAAGDLVSLDIEARHELRKELKKLRYGIEYLRALYPEERLKPFLKQLKRLQAVFGDLNDAAMAEALFLAPDAPALSDPLAQRAVGRVIGTRMARAELAWDHAQERWQDLGNTPKFWRDLPS